MSLDMNTHAAVQPDENLLLGRRIGRREEPEEQLVLVRRVAADGQEAGVGLAHVEVNIWDSLAVDGEFWREVVRLCDLTCPSGVNGCIMMYLLVVLAVRNLGGFDSRSTS